eukprot:c14466_g1_i2.p1 GENE.c14466_g1_i2~~c14466_g1_i2.p1  ORF type:complete len:765 (+),score=287.94 c14466_g1_i2:94-2388(+)
MIEFYKSHYSANLMRLVVIGPDSLDDLESMVKSKFSLIQNTNKQIFEFSESAFPKEYTKSIIRSAPVKPTRNLFIAFPVKNLPIYHKTKPHHFLGHMIGHEAKGSLLSYLKSRELVNTLVAGPSDISKDEYLFSVTVTLTEKGVSEWEEIVIALFQYINMLRHNLKSNSENVLDCYKEIQATGNIMFRYRELEEPSSYATRLAAELQKYSGLDVVTTPVLIETISLEDVESVLNYFNVDSVLIHLSTQTSEPFPNVEPFYNNPYSFEKLSYSLTQKLSATNFPEDLKLPNKNEFIPENFGLLSESEHDSPEDPPQLLINSQYLRLFFKPDVSFGLPKEHIFLELSCPAAYLTPKTTTLAILFARLVSDSLVEYSYDAEIAGLSYSFTNVVQGFIVSVCGYHDKLHVLLEKILKRMKTLTINSERFRLIKEQLQLEYDSFDTQPPAVLGMYARQYLTEVPRWHVDQYRAVIPEVTQNDLETFQKELLSKIKIEGLVHGNVSKKQCLDISEMITSILELKEAPENEFVNKRLIQIPIAPHAHLFVKHLLNENEVNNVCIYHVQIGCEQKREDVLLDLLQQTMNVPFFAQLRTVEQIGYVAMTRVDRRCKVQGLDFIIMSATKTASFIASRIISFFNQFEKSLNEMDEKEFARHTTALRGLKSQKEKTLAIKSARYWGEILSHAYSFNRNQEEVELIDTLKKEDLIAFYNEYFSNNSNSLKRRLCVQMRTQKSKIIEETETCEQLIEFKQIMKADQFKRSCLLFPSE